MIKNKEINVKRTFFFTGDLTDFIYIDPYLKSGPHYELEDGRILYSKWGAPAAGETFLGFMGDKGGNYVGAPYL